MITSKQAEEIAQMVVQEYVNACRCQSEQDIANVLMKLTSMCGLAMCATVGQPEAVARLQGTTDYIARTQAGKDWKKDTVQ